MAKENVLKMVENIRKTAKSLAMYKIKTDNTDISNLFQEILEKFSGVSKEVQDEFEFLKEDAEWDNYNIGFFGVTNAGKSTIIETLTGGNGTTIGTGERDFTTDIAIYNIPNFDKIRVVDMPGIEGNEQQHQKTIQKAVRKCHTLFYVLGTDKEPEEGTILKIKNYLEGRCEVYAVINLRGFADRYEHQKNLLNDASKQLVTITTEKFTKILGNQFKTIDTSQGERCLYLNAHLAYAMLNANHRDRNDYLNLFSDPSKAREFSNFNELETTIGRDFANKDIIQANISKFCSIIDKLILELTHQNKNLETIVLTNIKGQIKETNEKIKNIVKQKSEKIKTLINSQVDKLEIDLIKIVHKGIDEEWYKDKDKLNQEIKAIIDNFSKELDTIITNILKELEEAITEYLKELTGKLELFFSLDINIRIDLDTILEKLDRSFKDIFKTIFKFGYNLGATILGFLANPIIGGISAILALIDFIWGWFDDNDTREQRAKTKATEDIKNIMKNNVKPTLEKQINVELENLEKIVETELSSFSKGFEELEKFSAKIKEAITNITVSKENLKQQKQHKESTTHTNQNTENMFTNFAEAKEKSIMQLVNFQNQFNLSTINFKTDFDLLPYNFDETKIQLEIFIKQMQDNKFSIALFGAFSDGKSSIVSGLLKRTDIKISVEPANHQIETYEFGDFQIIDTPGLFADIIQHTEITKNYIAKAQVVIFTVDARNPIYETHIPTIQWILRDLQKLSATIFVVNKMDETTNLKNIDLFNNEVEIKKQSVLKLLKEKIGLNAEEQNKIKIIGVAANPYGKGMQHWLNENYDAYLQLSRIQNLKTEIQVFVNSSKDELFVKASQATMSDISQRIIIKFEELENKLEELRKISENSYATIQKELNQFKKSVNDVYSAITQDLINIRESIMVDFQGCNEYYQIKDKIDIHFGKDFNLLETKIISIIKKHTDKVDADAQTMSYNINQNIKLKDSLFAKLDNSFVSKFADVLKNTPIRTIADGILKGRDFLNLPIKFLPWGAMKLAKGAPIIGIVLEIIGIIARLVGANNFVIDKEKIINGIDTIFENLLKGCKDENGEEQGFTKERYDSFFSYITDIEKSLITIKEEIKRIEIRQALIKKEKEYYQEVV